MTRLLAVVVAALTLACTPADPHEIGDVNPDREVIGVEP